MIQLSLRQFEESRSSLDEAEKILDTFDAVESVVHASFYRTSADYYSVCCVIPCC
jgi:26S proteasome regulatory subunit N9